MSDRPLWMPSEEELYRAIYAYTGGGDSSKLEKVHRDLWLRAQIAVLIELRKEIRSHLGTECLLRNAEARYTYELSGRTLEALRKELE